MICLKRTNAIHQHWKLPGLITESEEGHTVWTPATQRKRALLQRTSENLGEKNQSQDSGYKTEMKTNLEFKEEKSIFHS